MTKVYDYWDDEIIREQKKMRELNVSRFLPGYDPVVHAIATIPRHWSNESYHHLAAYSLGPTAGAVVNAAMSGIADQALTKAASGNFLTPNVAQIAWASVFGATVQRARLNTPTLRYVSLPSINPVNTSATVPSPVNIYNALMSPIPLPKVDELGIDVSDSAIDTIFALVGMLVNKTGIPVGKRFRLHATGTIVGVVGAWVNGAIAMEQTLPQGQYLVVGMYVVAANVLAARLVFAGTNWRPGCLAANAAGSIPHPIFTNDQLGAYGKFENANVPNMDILLGSGANASQDIFLDVIRLSDIAA